MSDIQVLIEDARNYAESVVLDAREAMNAATRAAAEIPIRYMSYNPPRMPSYVAPKPIADYNGQVSVTFDPGTAPTIKEGVAIPTVEAIGAPDFSAELPTYTIPTPPSAIPDFSGVAPPINTNLTFPDAPTLIIPEAPLIAERVAPSAPTVTLPSFDAVVPVDTAVAPTNLDRTFAASYAEASPTFVARVSGYVDDMIAKVAPDFAAQRNMLKAALDKYFATGGINTEVEQHIYQRAQDRNDKEARRVEDAIYKESAGRGFTMPTGAINSQIQRARQESANLTAQKNNEIIIQQSDLYQKNIQFAVSTTAALIKSTTDTYVALMQNLGALNGQALDYAKSVMSALVESYNIQVRAFSSKIEAYRAQAAVFETNLKASMAGIELYRAQIDALQAQTNVDRAVVDVYRARLDTLTAASDLYRAQVDTVQAQANLEKLKMELFQTQVQAYTAQVGAKNAQWQSYTAQIEGEMSKVKMYSSQVDAYNAKVQAYRAKIDAQATAVNAAAATNRAISEQNSAALEAYKTIVSAKGEVARTQVAAGQLQVQAYEAMAHAAASEASAAAEYYKAVSSTNIEMGRLSVETMLENAKISINRGEILARVATSNAEIFADLAGSAMTGMTTLVHEANLT